MGKLHLIDISIVAIYLILCLVIGLRKSTKIKNIRDYAVGNKNFSTFIIIATVFATYVSGNTTVGNMEGVYNVGLLYAIPLLFTSFNWFIVKNIYAKRVNKFHDCISMSEIMYKLYGNVGLNLTNIVLVLRTIGFIAIQVTAIGYLFNYFFNFPYIQGVLIGVSILALYSALGGVRAVALTDVFQFLIFFVALPLVCGYAYFQAGGYDKIVSLLPETHLKIFTNANNTISFFSYIFWIVLPAVSPPYTQRLLMAKDKKQLMSSYNILMMLSIFFAITIFVLGFCIRTIYPGIDAKIALYTFIGNLPSISLGFMVAGILAVIMSTADSWLNSLSVIISHDVIKKIFPNISDRTELLSARIATVVCSIFAVIIALYSGEIFKLILLVENFYYALILIPFTVGFFNFKMAPIPLLASFISGFVCTLIIRLCVGEFGILSLTFGTLGSAIGFFVAYYIQVKMGIIKKEVKSGAFS